MPVPPHRPDGAAPLRVLHVVGAMDRGGIETWLMHLLRQVDRAQLAMDFVVHRDAPGAYEPEIRALGGRVFRCTDLRRPWRYAGALLRVLREQGPYDVVHSHVHHFSGPTLVLARLAGVPCRIAHSHNDTARLDAAGSRARRAYLRSARWAIRHCATAGLACAPAAADALFGLAWRADARWRVLPYGLDYAPFEQRPDRAAVRAELGLPAHAFVLGHVGRFEPQKNHAFLLDMAEQLLQLRPELHLLLVGEGPLRAAVEARVRTGVLAGRVHLTGSRPDVPRLMLGAMDAFAFPSHYEGLGLALVEAQAAGLPCLASTAVPGEAVVAGGLVTRLPLEAGPRAWAEAAARLEAGVRQAAQPQALAQVRASPFELARSLRELQGCYGAARGPLHAGASAAP